MSKPADTPKPPYYAVIFTSRRTAVDDGYGDTSQLMIDLASQQPGFLGYESARGEDGLGITEFVTRVARVERARRFAK